MAKNLGQKPGMKSHTYVVTYLRTEKAVNCLYNGVPPLKNKHKKYEQDQIVNCFEEKKQI